METEVSARELSRVSNFYPGRLETEPTEQESDLYYY